MADSVAPRDIDTILTNVSWAIRSTYHMVLKASPGAAIFGRDMLFDIPYIANWKKIGDYRQHQTDLSTQCEILAYDKNRIKSSAKAFSSVSQCSHFKSI